ncbi:hypothetical protein AAG565_09280 [Fontimonas sp. SYSU GA230001]|uniref:hypothetical protein n=1 Tax=Fontimonas sp. SYSU GA230001 TaxID=3142450 RepID=UPI0032B5BFFA
MRLLLFCVSAVAVLAALWLVLRPPAETPVPVSAPAAVVAAAGASPAPVPQPRRFSLAIPAAPGSDGVLHVRQGEPVELIVTSAKDDELHLHGYDLSLQLKAGEPATLAFVAEHAGRFEIELHHVHAEVGVLEVSPR